MCLRYVSRRDLKKTCVNDQEGLENPGTFQIILGMSRKGLDMSQVTALKIADTVSKFEICEYANRGALFVYSTIKPK